MPICSLSHDPVGRLSPLRRLTFTVLWVLLASQGLALDGPAHPADPADARQNDLLATLGSTKIRESDFQRFLQDSCPSEQIVEIRRNPDARKEALAGYLDLLVMIAKARKDGIDNLPAFQKAHELMEMKILVRLLTERDRERLSQHTSVTDEEIRDYYDQHTNQFQVQLGFTARQILIYVKGNPAFPVKGLDDADAETKAREALARLRAGESWERVAGVYSDDTGTRDRGGLIANGHFGYYPPEVEAALRQQEPGKLGDIVKSQFGYHVLQVERRTAEGEREPFATVRETIGARISSKKRLAAQAAYLEPIRAEVGLKETAAANTNMSLLDSSAIRPDEILATLGDASIREADFQWFLKDAYRPEQRMRVFSKPGARRELLASFLDMRVMEAKARKEGLDREPSFESTRALMEMKLLAEFLQERDGVTPWKLPGATEEARMTALKAYLNRLRVEMGLKENP